MHIGQRCSKVQSSTAGNCAHSMPLGVAVQQHLVHMWMAVPVAGISISATIVVATVIVLNARAVCVNGGYGQESRNFYRYLIFMWYLPCQLHLTRFACIRINKSITSCFKQHGVC